MELTTDEILQTPCNKHGVIECAKCEDAARKRDSRAREKQQKQQAEAEKKLGEATTFVEYWMQNRANLTEAQRAEFEARENLVLDDQYIMQLYLEGRYEQEADRRGLTEEERVTLPQLIEEVQSEIKTHGLCESIILVVPKLWASDEKGLREQIMAKGGAISTLLTYGYRLALDGFLYERFYQKYLMPRTEIQQTFTSITCSCGATSSISVEVARLYTTRIFRCGRCIAKDNAGKAELAKSLAKEYGQDQSQIYDGWGRIKL
jgi:hypothetical protein